MPPVTNAQFRSWLKSAANMKLSSDASVLRITHEGLTNFESFMDFDRDSIESLSKACSKSIDAIQADQANGIAAENAVPGTNISTISIRRLVVAAQAVKYYNAINRIPDFENMHYVDVLSNFKADHDAYVLLKKQTSPETPLVNDKDKEKRIIRWVPLFEDALSRTFGSKGPLVYVIRDNAEVPDVDDDPLDPNAHFGRSGSLLEELIVRLPHSGPIFKDDNKTVYMMIAKAVAGTSVESTIKSFSRRKDGRGAFNALVSNHAGDTKYRAIVKARNNLLQNIKWNGRSYSLEQHVSNHRTAIDDLRDCESHIGNAVPNVAQRVEYLLESISSQDSALQAAMGNVRANTNNLRTDFEAASNHLIEVDPYKRATGGGDKGKPAKVASLTFAGRGKSGVDLRWHTRHEFRDLSSEQKDELTEWQSSSDGRAKIKKQRASENKKRKGNPNEDKDRGGWKKKFKKAISTKSGLSHVMSVMLAEEEKQAPLVSALRPALPPVPQGTVPVPPAAAPAAAASVQGQASATIAQLAVAFPALSTKVKLNSILRNS